MSQSVTVSGHYGEFLQGRLGRDGPVVLVTLPCPPLRLTVMPMSGAPGIWPAQPGERGLRRRLFASLGRRVAGRWVIASELPRGAGAGASTAQLVALARAAGARDPLRIARACLAAEGAVDPLMWPYPARVLWASRQARMLATLPPLPQVEILGGLFGPGQRTNPDDQDFPDITDLVAAWPDACADAARLSALASESARRTLARRGPIGDPTEGLARRLGALGFAVAHTGSARALIFAPGTIPDGAKAVLRAAGLSHPVRFIPEISP